jgi:hypothetical protein
VKKRLLALAAIATAGALSFWIALTSISCGERNADTQLAQPGRTATPNVDLEHSFARPKEAGAPVYHEWVGEAWRPIIGEENWQGNIVDDPQRSGVVEAVGFEQLVVEFRDFPLYWVGLEFQGLPLGKITRDHRPFLALPTDHVILAYGTCTPLPEVGCSLPLQIRVEPYCYAQPGMYAPVAKDGAVFQVRGADAQYIGGGLQLWMGDVAVKVYGHPQERQLQAAQALVAASGEGPTSADEPFPPLDSDCSDFTLEPYFSE